MSDKFEIIEDRWIVKTEKVKEHVYESGIKIKAISEVSINYPALSIRLYTNGKTEPFLLVYDKNEKKQFDKDLKQLKDLIYK